MEYHDTCIIPGFGLRLLQTLEDGKAIWKEKFVG